MSEALASEDNCLMSDENLFHLNGKVSITREWLQSLDLFQVAFEQEGYIVPQAMVFQVSHLVIYVVKRGGTKDLF